MKRRRLIVAAAILTAIAVAGAAWLVSLATGGTTPAALFATPGASTTSTESVPDGTPTTAGPEPTSRPTTAGPRATASRKTTGPAGPTRTRSSSPVGKPPVPDKLIQVGGVTLDNTSPRTQCALFRNKLAVSVKVESIVLSSENDVVVSSAQCEGIDADAEFRAPVACSGATLRSGGTGCYVGFKPTATTPAEYHATVRLRLQVRCTGASGTPCDDSELSPAPSASRPVDVHWVEQSGRDLCYRVSDDPLDNIFC